MPRAAPRHDRDAGGPAEVLAAKAGLRQEVWSAMREARVARFPGAAGRIPNFTGAEAAAERLRGMPAWQAAGTVKANPDSAQWPVRQRALEDGKTVYMAVGGGNHSASGGGTAYNGAHHVHVYLDGKKIYSQVQAAAVTTQRRTGSNSLQAVDSATGRG